MEAQVTNSSTVAGAASSGGKKESLPTSPKLTEPATDVDRTVQPKDPFDHPSWRVAAPYILGVDLVPHSSNKQGLEYDKR